MNIAAPLAQKMRTLLFLTTYSRNSATVTRWAVGHGEHVLALKIDQLCPLSSTPMEILEAESMIQQILPVIC